MLPLKRLHKTLKRLKGMLQKTKLLSRKRRWGVKFLQIKREQKIGGVFGRFAEFWTKLTSWQHAHQHGGDVLTGGKGSQQMPQTWTMSCSKDQICWIKNAVHAAVKRSEDRKMLQLRTKGQMFTYLKEIKSVFVSLINKECSTPTQQTIV